MSAINLCVRKTNGALPALKNIAWLVTLAVLSGCATIPENFPKTPSYAISDTADTRLAKEVREWEAHYEGLSGFYPLSSGTDAFAARLHLIETAEVSIDAQYFLMKADTAGHIFSEELMLAADRGVRVRFLLDDVFSSVTDEELFVLDSHENIEVRLFNPISRKGIYYLNFAGDFRRANRRMHSKSFTVDNEVSIVGGRNIADEYFELNTASDFADFDILCVGEVASDVSETFDAFWNSSKALPLAALEVEFSAEELATTRQSMIDAFGGVHNTVYAESLANPLVLSLIDDIDKLYPATWEVITDEPQKLDVRQDPAEQKLANRIGEIGQAATKEIIVYSPYFVPMQSGMDYWRSLTEKGIRVVVITNSLASTNHVAVHSAYAKYRKPLIEMGVELYEARADAVLSSDDPDAPDNLTLHTKGIVIDRDKIFIGSLNLDPRSIDINAEMGVVVESRELGQEVSVDVLEDISLWTYHVTLDEKGKLQWHAMIDGQEVIETKEPQTSGWLRFKAWVQRIVPDSQL